MTTLGNDLDPPYVERAKCRSKSRVRPEPPPRAALEGAESVPRFRHYRPHLEQCACRGFGVLPVKERGVHGISFLKRLQVQEVKNIYRSRCCKKESKSMLSLFLLIYRGATCASVIVTSRSL